MTIIEHLCVSESRDAGGVVRGDGAASAGGVRADRNGEAPHSNVTSRAYGALGFWVQI